MQGTTARHPMQELTCRVRDVADATHDVRIVHLDIVDGGRFRFSAGQYAGVAFGGLPARDYSMANRPDQEDLEFHIRNVEDGGASEYVAKELRTGDLVRVTGPDGDAWLRPDHSGPILAVAGGAGLAPIKSIVETALAAGMRQDIHLYFGVREERDLYLLDHFEGLSRAHPNLSFVPVLSEPSGPTSHRSGLVGAVVAADLASVSGFKAYLAGPPAMIEAAVAMLEERRLAADDIHADPFYSEDEMVRRGRRPR